MDWDQFLTVFTRPLFRLGQAEVSLSSLTQLVIVVGLAFVAAGLARRILRERLLPRTKLDRGLQFAIARMAGYVVAAVGLLVGLQTLGVDLTSLTVLAGALGIGIGFGLQNIVSNFVSGLIILAERPIQLGDRVEVGDAVGQVVRIGARSSSVLTNDNIMLIIPNSEFVSGRVVNWDAGNDPRVRFRIPVGVSYGSDPRLVEKLLLEAAAENPRVLADPAPGVQFIRFGDSSLDFELRAWSTELAHRPGALRSEMNFAIWEKFKQHGIEIPFPQRDLHVKEPVKVEVSPPAV
jgi:small-conductance mechanosensitive channel